MTYEKGMLEQDLGFVRPKYVLQEGLLKKIRQDAPNLAHTFDVTFDYPKRETFAQSPDGKQSPVRRRIVLKRLSSIPIQKGLGGVYTSANFATGSGKDLIGTEATAIGQVDEHTIEISVWTPDSKDRDLLLELIKMWMLELTQRIEPETGQRFFNRNGVFAVQEVKAYENIDRKNDQTSNYLGILVYKLICPFYGVQVETFEKIKFDIINNLYDSTDPQVVIVDKPTVVEPPYRDTVSIETDSKPGPGNMLSKEEDTVTMPDPPVIGGSGEAYPDILVIPGERTGGGHQDYDLSLLNEEDY